jgi:hypothetical protein
MIARRQPSGALHAVLKAPPAAGSWVLIAAGGPIGLGMLALVAASFLRIGLRRGVTWQGRRYYGAGTRPAGALAPAPPAARLESATHAPLTDRQGFA